MYALALSAFGFETMTAANEMQAYERAWTVRPDIIVTDWPTRDDAGPDFLQQLKQNSRTRDIPVVVVCGHVQRAWRERAECDGFAAFFPKPCLPEQLATGLRQVLDGRAYVFAH